uniref:Neurotransmitter-gated ion-channel ligand-binding domain-containing protein n=1 Tax=Plectus sambesii TaxID=2011161 RepID=A0A914XHP0_9BILA
MKFIAFLSFISLLRFDYSFGSAISAENGECTGKEAILEKLLNSYDKDKIPSTQGLAIVDVDLLFDNEIDATASQGPMEVDIFVRQSWQDAALNFDNMSPCMQNISLDDMHAHQIWKPEAKFLSYGEFEPDMALPITPEVLSKPFFILKSDGTVLRYERVRVKIFCTKAHDNFPFLSQSCTIIYGSLVHNKDEVVMKQSISKDSLITQSSTAENFLRYEAQEWNMDTPNGKSSTIKINFSLQKKLKKLIHMFYAPSALIVAISWLTFLLGPLVIARAVTVVGSLVLLFIHFGVHSADFPKSTTITAIDTWMLVCIVFVFSAVVELAVVSCMASTRRPRRSSRGGGFCRCVNNRRASYSTVPVVRSTTAGSDPLYEELNVMKNEKTADNKRTCTCCRVCALGIDFISFIVYPCLFVLFNIFYWTANDQIMWFFNLL